MENLLYHGSIISGIETLNPVSKLHNSDEKVIYLSSSPVYAMLYIWSKKNTGTSLKHIAAWLKDGITYYEEQFPNKFWEFYHNVSGYVYTAEKSPDFKSVNNREDMYYSQNLVKTIKSDFIADVYNKFTEYEKEGKFKLLKFEERTAEKQEFLVNIIAQYINKENLLTLETEESLF